jgi:hypothetical protein
MLLIMIIALVTAMAPAALVAVGLVVLGVWIARLLEPDTPKLFRDSWRFLGSLVLNVAIFLLPMTIDVILAGRRAFEIFGLPRGPWSVPTFSYVLRGVDGTFGTSWWGWLLPLAALFAFVLCQGERRRVASKLAVIATLSLALTVLASRHWLGSFSPDLDVLLALYAVMLASLIGLGIGALEHDLRDAGFGWRQITAGLSVVTLVVAIVPFLGSFASGRFDMPTTSVAESLSQLTPTKAGGYRVLWLGDPSVLPIAGWTVAPGLEAATSMNGLPGGSTLFSPPDSGTSDVIMEAIQTALDGRTVRLGQLLAPAGISAIVVMNSAAPEIAGVQSVPMHRVPGVLLNALNNQSDLALELDTPSVEVFSNSLFHGIVAATNPGSTTLTPIFSDRSNSGALTAGSTVVAGLAPAGAFALDVDGHAAPRTTYDSWTPYYSVATIPTKPMGTIALRQFPLNGLIALFTLGMWAIVWLGCGWVQRLEWLFTGRRRRVVTPRDSKDDRA